MGTDQEHVPKFVYYTKDTPQAEMHATCPAGYGVDFTRAELASEIFQSSTVKARGGMWKAPVISSRDLPNADDAAAVAMEAFFKALADQFPERTTGDLDPIANRRFGLACNDVAKAWLDANPPTLWTSARIATFANDLLGDHQHNGWSCGLDMGGTIEWHRSASRYTVYATPDYDSEAPTIEIQISKDDGEVPHSESIPWPLAERTPESYMAIVRPFLDKWSLARHLVVKFDVTELDEDAIDALTGEVVVQASDSDDHPNVKVVYSAVVEVPHGA